MSNGTITFVNSDKGYGFLEGDEGDVFFHVSQVQGRGFSSLYVGQECEYTDKPGSKTRIATSVVPLGEVRDATARKLFVKVSFGKGVAPRKIEFPMNLTVTSDDGSTFRLTHAIRQGGNGVVFRAEHITDDGLVTGTCAVKVLKQLDPQRVDRFSNEIRVLRLLNHSSVAKYYSHGRFVVEGIQLPWVALDLGGDNLRNHIDQDGPIDMAALKVVVPQMCAALAHLHELGFIHRDIKPDNFVWRDVLSHDTMMIDFGIAKRVDEDISARPLDGFTKQLEFVGPVFFSSPELIAYARDKSHLVDSRSDMFQLGKVIWFLTTGDISAGIPSKRKDPTGGAVHSLVVDLLHDDPEDRLQSLASVSERVVSFWGRNLIS